LADAAPADAQSVDSYRPHRRKPRIRSINTMPAALECAAQLRGPCIRSLPLTALVVVSIPLVCFPAAHVLVVFERWSRRAKSSQALALPSRIVLACAEGVDNKTVAARLGVRGGDGRQVATIQGVGCSRPWTRTARSKRRWSSASPATHSTRTFGSPYHLPHWSFRAASAATWSVRDGELTLTIPVDQPLWCPDLHEEPLRVSCIQSGSFAGPLGSAIGQMPFREGLVVREEQRRCWPRWSPERGSVGLGRRQWKPPSLVTSRDSSPRWPSLLLQLVHRIVECRCCCRGYHSIAILDQFNVRRWQPPVDLLITSTRRITETTRSSCKDDRRAQVGRGQPRRAEKKGVGRDRKAAFNLPLYEGGYVDVTLEEI
jgi:hypothetical protein